jgi:hypothetical protein
MSADDNRDTLVRAAHEAAARLAAMQYPVRPSRDDERRAAGAGVRGAPEVRWRDELDQRSSGASVVSAADPQGITITTAIVPPHLARSLAIVYGSGNSRARATVAIGDALRVGGLRCRGLERVAGGGYRVCSHAASWSGRLTGRLRSGRSR